MPDIDVREAMMRPYQSMFRKRRIENEPGSSSRYGAIIVEMYLSNDCTLAAYAGIPSGWISMFTIMKKT